MRALQVLRLSEDMSGVGIGELARPAPGPGEVVVRVRAASVNFPDLLMTRGAYQRKPDPPFTLGGDLAGEVLAMGAGVTGVAVGDRVCAVRFGAFAEEVALAEAVVTPLPTCLSFAQGAAFGAAYMTAYVALVERGRLAPGEWVLVHGAAGGMGLAAVDLAAALGGRVIAASTSDAKLAAIDALYRPDHLLNTANGFREQVKALTAGGADLIFDPVNGDVFDESMRCIAFDGRLLVIGFTAGRITSVPTNMALIKGVSVVGVRAGEYGRHFPDRRRRIIETLGDLVGRGAIRPHVHAELPLERWREAFALMETRAAVGKVVLTL
ncbi:MAG: zinc-containing alcohol dehydrogenase [Bradyrhizobium sp.]|nr:zinc-containing alcohol dehydrogenase [Bradyrhizobium sp.]